MYSVNKKFALCFGFGGKTAINVFLLITGYFMCKKEFCWQKVINLLCLMVFYRWIIYAIFIFSGYEKFSGLEFIKTILFVPLDFGRGFSSSFLGIYLLIPFLNKAIQNFEKKDFQYLILTLVFLFTVLSSFFLNSAFEYIGWYATVYFIGAYFRLYPIELFKNTRTCFFLSMASLALCYASIIFISFAGTKLNKNLPIYWFVNDSNKILAISTAIFLFLFFKNIKIGSNRFINKLAASTFGVLMIHASSDTMRRWLWQDVCKNTEVFAKSNFILLAVLCTFAVYVVCVSIDILRKFFTDRILRIFSK